MADYLINILEEGAGLDALEPELLVLAEDYSNESGLNLTFDLGHSKSSLHNFASSDNCIILVIFKGSSLIGFAIIAFDRLWSIKENCTLYMFYIVPEHRTYVPSKRLIDACCDIAKDRGAVTMFSNTISKINERTTKAYEALLKRKGFEVVSPLFMKEL